MKKVKRIDRNYIWIRIIPLWVIMVSALGCSHDYTADTMDLGTYQWNMWPDVKANWEVDSTLLLHPPSCGWEVLHRGNGKLVRIPALMDEHFPGEQATVTWFHCRHTLPELWAEREVTLNFGGVSTRAEVYLNEKLVGTHLGRNIPFLLDISDEVYYVRDNHLAIRVYDPVAGSGGITGKILLVSKPDDQLHRKDLGKR